MVKLTIDNKQVEIEDGATILAAAIKAGIHIPTLCYNEELTPAGACRLCVVEIVSEKDPVTVSSCNYPVGEGMIVSTTSEAVIKARRIAIEVLLAQNPNSSIIKKIAGSLGIEAGRFTIGKDCSHGCILCRLCVRTCQEVVGLSAITFEAQGLERDNNGAHVAWDEEACIACGSCAFVCPTDAVTTVDEGDKRIIQTPTAKMVFALKACTKCGSYYAPEKQLAYMAKTANLPLEKFDLCMDCRD
ncbi:MAG: 2Fe-2S iron-sulfur cluster-binding protein [Dehalococcoidia bacterium]|nr:2Fe-2S iron-sulfur cluster-binding protein [Dehalococcoidia bacterium]